MIISTQLETSVLFLFLDYFLIEFIFHAIEDNGAIALVIPFNLGDDVADVWLDHWQAVVKPRLDEMSELMFFKVRIFDEILFFDEVFKGSCTHIQDTDEFDWVLKP